MMQPLQPLIRYCFLEARQRVSSVVVAGGHSLHELQRTLHFCLQEYDRNKQCSGTTNASCLCRCAWLCSLSLGHCRFSSRCHKDGAFVVRQQGVLPATFLLDLHNRHCCLPCSAKLLLLACRTRTARACGHWPYLIHKELPILSVIVSAPACRQYLAVGKLLANSHDLSIFQLQPVQGPSGNNISNEMSCTGASSVFSANLQFGRRVRPQLPSRQYLAVWPCYPSCGRSAATSSSCIGPGNRCAWPRARCL